MKIVSNNRKTRFLILFFLLFIWQIVLAVDFIKVDPDKVKDLSVDTAVQTQGVVITEPGILGKQFFYINGVQVYSYYKDFPELLIGDEVLVKGVISQSRGEKRIKTKTREDIKTLAQGLITKPQLIAINKIDSQLVGHLIKIKGQVIEKTGQKIFVDDNTGEILTYVKQYTLIDKSRIKEGNQVEIIGVLSQSNDELRVLPRSDQDIQIIVNQEIEIDKQIQQINYQILASSAGINDFSKLELYFIISAVILAIIFITLILLRIRGKE